MKKILTTFASLAIMIGVVGMTQASAAAASPLHTTSAPPAARVKADAKLSFLKEDKRLDRQQLKALGLKPLSSQEVARIHGLSRSNGTAKTAAVGSYYLYSWHNYLFSWADRYYSEYSYYYNSNESVYYYFYYDNWKTCTTTGSGCIDAHAYTYFYYEYLYYYGTWYSYGPYGYPGYGPYSD